MRPAQIAVATASSSMGGAHRVTAEALQSGAAGVLKRRAASPPSPPTFRVAMYRQDGRCALPGWRRRTV
eukprot:scaffold1504_cov417-Prasinococcus_capsulatus_cf.AAC.13